MNDNDKIFFSEEEVLGLWVFMDKMRDILLKHPDGGFNPLYEKTTKMAANCLADVMDEVCGMVNKKREDLQKNCPTAIQEQKISINIWDDYWDDNHVPDGKKQETYIYVEEMDIPQEKQKEFLLKILNYISGDYGGARFYMFFNYSRWEIRVDGLTHKNRHKLFAELDNSGLSIDNGGSFVFYSES